MYVFVCQQVVGRIPALHWLQWGHREQQKATWLWIVGWPVVENIQNAPGKMIPGVGVGSSGQLLMSLYREKNLNLKSYQWERV